MVKMDAVYDFLCDYGCIETLRKIGVGLKAIGIAVLIILAIVGLLVAYAWIIEHANRETIIVAAVFGFFALCYAIGDLIG